jgi:hypothetical protein
MSRFVDFFWPTLEAATAAEAAEDRQSEIRDIEVARAHRWAPNEELTLEEARRLADAEEDRRRSAEGKATTYLLFIAAFAAALIPFLPGILEGKTGAAPGWLIAIILIIAAAYLVAAGIWAFKTLKVGTYHRLDVADLAEIWGNKHPQRALVQETFAITRRNYQAVNVKVSCIKMAHAFMARSIVLFGVLIVVEAGWEAGSSVYRQYTIVATPHSATVEKKSSTDSSSNNITTQSDGASEKRKPPAPPTNSADDKSDQALPAKNSSTRNSSSAPAMDSAKSADH